MQMQKAQAKLAEINEKKYEDQAIHFLNAYWSEPTLAVGKDQEKLEKVYTACLLMEKLDKKLGKEGTKLDEFESHLFLEKTEGALSAHEMRDALSAIDIDFDKKTSLMEFLIYMFQIKNWPYVATFVGGASPEDQRALEQAKAGMNKATAALEDSKAKEDAAHKAAEEAAAAKEAADEEQVIAEKAAASSKQAESELAEAKAEAEKALAELQEEEEKRASEIAKQKTMSEDESLSTVKENRALAMLKILESEDPQPLRTAKITQEAAVRKVDKAAKKAKQAATNNEIAAKAAAQKATEAEKTQHELTAAEAEAAEAVELADAACSSAEELLDAAVEKVNKGGGLAMSGQEGALWWMDRQFEDAKKYMSKKQIAKMEAQRARRTASLSERALPTAP